MAYSTKLAGVSKIPIFFNTQKLSEGDVVTVKHEPLIKAGLEFPNCINVYAGDAIIGCIPEPTNDPDTPQLKLIEEMKEKGTNFLTGTVTALKYKSVPYTEHVSIEARTMKQKEIDAIFNRDYDTIFDSVTLKEMRRTNEANSENVIVNSVTVKIGSGSVEYTEKNGYMINDGVRYRKNPENGKLYMSITSFLSEKSDHIVHPSKAGALNSWRHALGQRGHGIVLKYLANEGTALHDTLDVLLWMWGNLPPEQREQLREKMKTHTRQTRVRKVLYDGDFGGISTEGVNEEAHIVWDDELMLCGTIDLYWWDDETLVVGDHKRSKFTPMPSIEKELQNSFYCRNLKRVLKAQKVRGEVYFWQLDNEDENELMVPVILDEKLIEERYENIAALTRGETLY